MTPSKINWPYSAEEAAKLGDLFSASEIQQYSKNFAEAVAAAGKENSVASKFLVNGQARNAEFFGIEGIEKLIARAKTKGKVAGIRVYYGLTYESLDEKSGASKVSKAPIKDSNDAQLRPRLFLVAVDENGKDIEIDHVGFKDNPDGNGVGNGSPQPPYGQS